ncbi:MAG: DUF5060 domain-containing protein [Anaerolineae bacterium]|jgi:hypothetical protein
MKRALTLIVAAVALVAGVCWLVFPLGRAADDGPVDLIPTAFAYLPFVRRDSGPTAQPPLTPTPTLVPGETGEVTNLQHNAGDYPDGVVPRYGLFELRFDLTVDYPHKYYFFDPEDTPQRDPGRESPYGVDGVSVDAHFLAPSGAELTVPAFWYEEQTRRVEGEVETVEPTGEAWWAVRFAPSEEGQHRFYLTVQDKHGTTRHPESGHLTVSVGTSESRGFIRLDADDPRWLVYDDGTPFIGVASDSLQFWGASRLGAAWYEREIARVADYGTNLLRVWTECDGGYGLVFESRYTEGTPGDPASAPKGTWVNQPSAWRIDRVLEAAQTHGVALLFSAHGDVYWQWDASVRHEGWNPDPVAWDDWRHLNYWKRNFRLRVARFGWSTAVLAWSTWNEHGHISPDTDIYRFYQSYSEYQRAADPYNHLLTTGFGSQVWEPSFWASGAVDIATYHDYMMCRRYPALCGDVAEFVHRFSQCLRSEDLDWSGDHGCGLGIRWDLEGVGSGMPILWSEFGIGADDWAAGPLLEAYQGEAGARATHNRLWAGLFSPLGTAPIEWYWNAQDDVTRERTAASTEVARLFFDAFSHEGVGFAATEDVNVGNYVGPSVESDGARALAIILPGGEGIYAWLQNPAHTWADAPNLPAPISGQFTVPGVERGTYRVEWWNTRDGTTTDGGTVTVGEDTNLTLEYQDLVRDVAVKIVR